MRLREIAHARTGDKGDTVNISLIAYRPEDLALLERYVTAERVATHFAGIVRGPVRRIDRVDVPAGPLRGLEDRDLVPACERTRGRETGNPRADDRDTHRVHSTCEGCIRLPDVEP